MKVQNESVAIQIREELPPDGGGNNGSSRCHRIGIHLPLAVGDVTAVVGALFTGFSDYSAAFPASYAVLGVACLTAHYLVGKYGDLSMVAERVGQATRQLNEEVSNLSGINERLREENGDLKRVQEIMGKQREERERSLKQFDATVEELRQENERLKAETNRLNDSLSRFQERVTHLKETREAFKETLQRVQSKITAFQGMDILLNRSTEKVQQGLDKDLEELETEIEQIRFVAGSLIERFAKEREELNRQIEGLRSEKRDIDSLQGRFAGQIAELNALGKETKTTEDQIAKTRESLSEEIERLQNAQRLFSQEKKKLLAQLEEERKQIEQERNLISQERERLEQLQRQFQAGAQEQEEFNRRIESQMKKLGDIV